jgi:C-terminal processing protease CtpA/Prc
MPYLRAYFDALEDLDTSEQHTKLEIEGIKTTLQKAMADFDTSKALVLDVRFNGGGKDEVGMEIISNFNEKRRLVFSKKARLKNGYTPNNKVYLEASTQPYKKPVFILTSRESASATEIMILSSLLLENVYRIGNHTEGVFSDVMEKALPNGWEVGLSNEVYLDTKGTNYENIGIPPTVSLNYENDRQRFFRSIATDLEGDKQNILKEIREIMNSN